MRRIAILFVLAISLTSCVKEPGAIQAEPVSGNIHAGKSCDGLLAERTRIDADYAKAEAHQNQVNSNSITNIVFFELRMLNAMDKTNERAIARLKGEREAVDHALAERKCAQNP